MIVKHTIEIIVASETEAKQVKGLLDKYRFTAEGVKSIDHYYNTFVFMVTDKIKKMVNRR